MCHEVQRITVHLCGSVVMMYRQIIDIGTSQSQYSAVPIHVVISNRDQMYGRIDRAHGLGVAIIVAGISFGVTVPAHPVAPDFISYFPILHSKGLWVPVGR